MVVCGGVWWFAVVCGGLRWFVVVCGDLRVVCLLVIPFHFGTYAESGPTQFEDFRNYF